MRPLEVQIDLHGLRPEVALGRLGQGLHAARVRGESEVLVVTGRGWGNRDQQPVLRQRVESWLQGPEGRRAGVRGFQQRAKGGALLVKLA
ncbi:MAG: Smr/MutS family protein [Planctomycetota bacterium]|nr:Smr/MutS family protein [Planctomycetota bacterium]